MACSGQAPEIVKCLPAPGENITSPRWTYWQHRYVRCRTQKHLLMFVQWCVPY